MVMWNVSCGSVENKWLVKSLLFQSRAMCCWAFIFTSQVSPRGCSCALQCACPTLPKWRIWFDVDFLSCSPLIQLLLFICLLKGFLHLMGKVFLLVKVAVQSRNRGVRAFVFVLQPSAGKKRSLGGGGRGSSDGNIRGRENKSVNAYPEAWGESPAEVQKLMLFWVGLVVGAKRS